MGQENGHVNLVEWPPSSASPATEGQQLGLLNASFSVASTKGEHESQRFFVVFYS
jgi:hypothetical protein